jgi:hypothetical protein
VGDDNWPIRVGLGSTVRRNALESKILFIGESAPANGKFFYVKSNMTTHTMRAFEKALGAQFEDIDNFHSFFMSRGCYLDDLSLVSVIGLERKERERSFGKACLSWQAAFELRIPRSWSSR